MTIGEDFQFVVKAMSQWEVQDTSHLWAKSLRTLREPSAVDQFILTTCVQNSQRKPASWKLAPFTGSAEMDEQTGSEVSYTFSMDFFYGFSLLH